MNCVKCNKTFKTAGWLKRHQNNRVPCDVIPPPSVCNKCNKTYKNDAGLKAHQKRTTTCDAPLVCAKCNKTFKSAGGLKIHKRSCDAPPIVGPPMIFVQTPHAVGQYLRGWQMAVPSGYADPLAFLQHVKPKIKAKLIEELIEWKGIKFQLAMQIKLRKTNPDEQEETTDPVFRIKQETVLQAHKISDIIDKALPYIQELLEKWTQHGSGWVVDEVKTLWLDIAK